MSDIIIDTSFDVTSDSNGKDPDSNSKMLRLYHKKLWSKKLPNGKILDLDENLNNISNAGIFSFGSDSIIHTFCRWKRYQHIISQIDTKALEEFFYFANTVGGYTIFPNNTIDGVQTINRARGLKKIINDRFDLTLECIRRFYNNENSPLYEELKAYSDFFLLFENFKGYVDFFFFQDLLCGDYKTINFFHPFNDFGDETLPSSVKEYYDYKNKCINFVLSRNKRIEQWAMNNL